VHSILFVHGTGTRELDYAPTLRRIQGRLPRFRILPCLWGDACGAKLNCGGRSIPDYEEQSPSPAPPDTQIALARWDLLYQDPLFELRLLEQRHGERENLPPSAAQPGERAVEQARAAQAPANFLAQLARLGLVDLWPDARIAVVDDPAFAELLLDANLDPLDTTRPIARALVAALLSRAENLGFPAVAAPTRDALTKALVEPLGGQPAGVLQWGLGLLAPYATRKLQRRLRGIFDEHSAKIADIIHYQARGQAIREYIRRRIAEAGKETNEKIVVLCHSLGGVAAVDLLIAQPMPEVRQLITVGSQAGFFYDVDALVSLPYPQPLPDRFPPWCNIYDTADFLSYRAEGVFPGRVSDVRVDNGQPFAQSHSAYWDNPKVIEEIERYS
jgi:hypothetical protein